MSKKIILIYSGIIIFVLFILFSWIVHKNTLNALDFNLTVKLQDHISRRFDELFSILSLIGNFESVSIILGIILLISRKLIGGLFVIGAYGFFHLMELYGKTFVKHNPPPHFLLRTHLPFNFPQFYVSTENSFPSGHAGRAFFLTTIVYILVMKSKKFSPSQKNIILIALLCYDLIMATSRVYLGEHWTTDVVGGTLAGISLGLLSGLFL